jgi:hypothetical protein
MFKISKQQISNRWDTLPMSLRESLYSPEYGKVIWQIGANHHLDDKKIGVVAGLAGYVLFGFIHPEDLAKEIRESLNLNPEIANSIAQEIDRKIFTPIRADLEKVYAPAIALAEEGQPPAEEILDLKTAAKEIKPAEEAAFPGVEALMAEAGAPTPSPVEEPKIIPTEEKIQPKPEEIQPVEVPKPEIPEGPVIIHKEAEFKLISETKKSFGGLFGFLRKGKKEEEKISPVKARVEIGLIEADKRGSQDIIEADLRGKAKTEPPKARVIHYTEFPTPISPFSAEERKEKKEERKEERPAGEIPPKSALSPRESALDKIKPPENLPAEPPKVEEKISIEPPVKSEAKPLDLRKTPAVAEAALAGRPEESKPTPEGEEIINLSSFR